MASISKRGDKWFIRFVFNGQRRTIALGTKADRQATAIKLKLESLISARSHGLPPDPEVSNWLTRIKPAFRARLTAVGLIEASTPAPAHDSDDQAPAPEDTVIRLGVFLADYFKRRTDVKPGTKLNWSNTRRNLLEFFGASKAIAEITTGEARDFERWLRTSARQIGYANADETEGLGKATVAKRIKNAKQFFGDAVERELIARNPFAPLKCAAQTNPERQFFIDRATSQQVIDACPDAEWRLIFALSRYGGLRCPSEHFALRLNHVDWERRRFLVHSCKTERHDGKATRWVPIFPELHPFLEEAFNAAPEGATYFIRRYRDPSTNLRTKMLRIIHQSGVEEWPKLFHNLRASRQTELEEIFPSHVVCAWLGNTEKVARDHYLQVTDDHFSRAIDPDEVERSIFVASKTPQQDATRRKHRKNPQVFAYPRNSVGPEGFEPPTKGL